MAYVSSSTVNLISPGKGNLFEPFDEIFNKTILTEVDLTLCFNMNITEIEHYHSVLKCELTYRSRVCIVWLREICPKTRMDHYACIQTNKIIIK